MPKSREELIQEANSLRYNIEQWEDSANYHYDNDEMEEGEKLMEAIADGKERLKELEKQIDSQDPERG